MHRRAPARAPPRPAESASGKFEIAWPLSSQPSIEFDAQLCHELAVKCKLLRDEPPEFVRRVADGIDGEIDEFLHHVRRTHGFNDRLIEPRNDSARRIRRRKKTEPA